MFLQFRDCLNAADFLNREDQPITRLNVVEPEALFYLEILGNAAGIRADRAALRLLNSNLAVSPINLGDQTRKVLLGQSSRTDERYGRSTCQNHLCNFQWWSPEF